MSTKKPRTKRLSSAQTKVADLLRQLKQARDFARFESLSPSAQRVAIAKDALAQLNASTYRAAHTYCDLKKTVPADVPLHESLRSIPRCYVCARGALFLSAVRKSNNFTPDYDTSHISDDEFAPVEDRFFTRKQCDLIEAVYEGFPNMTPSGSDFHDHYSNDNERLAAILRNIIKNNGTFIP